MKNKFKKIEEYEVLTPYGWVKFDSVAKINLKVIIMKITLEDGNYIEVSTDHIFLLEGIEMKAIDLIEGDVLDTISGKKRIDKITFNKKKENVYSLIDVASPDNSYYTNDIVSKNCQFLGSNSSLIDSDVLERIVFKIPKHTKWTGLFSIYEQPVNNAEYVIGVDSCKGTGRDYAVIQVLRIRNEFDLEQVALYRNNTIAPRDFAHVCVSIAQYYNNAHMMIENNDIGHAVCDCVWYELEYENLVNLDPKSLGVRSTKKSKKIANILLKEYVEKNWLKLCDERTIYELSRYEEIKPGIFAAGKHEHDDAVTSLLWSLYFIKSDEYSGKSYDKIGISNEYNVQYGEYDEDEEISDNSVINIDGSGSEGSDPNYTPYIDEDNF